MKKLILLLSSLLLLMSCQSISKNNETNTSNGSGETFSFHLQEGTQKLLVKKKATVLQNEDIEFCLANEFLINRNISINEDSILINKETIASEGMDNRGPYLKQYPTKWTTDPNLFEEYGLKRLSPDYDSPNYNPYDPIAKSFIEDLYTYNNTYVPVIMSLFDYSYSCKDNNLSILIEKDNVQNISKLINKTTDYDFSESEYKDYLLNSAYSLNELTAETFNEYQFTISLLNDKTFQMNKEYPFIYELRLQDNEEPIYVPTSFHFWKSYDPTEFALKGGSELCDSSVIPTLPSFIEKVQIGYFIRCTKELKIIDSHWSRTIIYNDNGNQIPVTYSTEYITTN